MKKKNLNKKLDLGKKQISTLSGVNGGVASHISCTVGGGICTSQIIKTCTWHSELYSACTCPPSWRLDCESLDRPCEHTRSPNCLPNTGRTCEV